MSWLWCWEGLGAGREGANSGWDGWMASPTRWAWVWVNSGNGDGQGGLACCDSWGRKESDTTERLNWTEDPLMFQNSRLTYQGVVLGWDRCLFLNNFIYFFIFDCAGSSLLHGLSLVAVTGGSSYQCLVSVFVEHRFRAHWLQSLQHMGSVTVAPRL